jgi:hypothetical protein
MKGRGARNKRKQESIMQITEVSRILGGEMDLAFLLAVHLPAVTLLLLFKVLEREAGGRHRVRRLFKF